MINPGEIAIVGAAESTRIGAVPDMAQIMLHADAALNAMADAGLKPADIDGVACVGPMMPQQIAHYLGITPKWVDGTGVGGCSFMLHVRHAAAAIHAGYCKTVLITHGESGKSRVNGTPRPAEPQSLNGQFEAPFGPMGPPTLFPIPVLRYKKTYGVTHEQMAQVAVVQREWAAKNPRAAFKDPITIDDVLNSKMIAYPFRLLQCCLVTDGGGALILTSSRAFRVAGPEAFRMAGIKHSDVDHLMIYDAFAHLPMYGLEDLGFVKRGEAKDFIWERNTAPGGKLPINTNGGGLSYTHTGMYGMFALQESVRQVRGTAPAQVPNVKISVAHGVGGMFSASGTVVLSNQRP